MTSRTIRAWAAVLGGFLVHLTLGSIYSIGNIVPYVISYIREYSHPATVDYVDGTWIFAMALVGQGACMFLGGVINKKLGPRWTTFIGSAIVSLGMFLTSVAVTASYYFTVFTAGLLFGAGVGLAYAPPLACAMKWMPQRKGLVNGIVLAGFGGGAFVFNQIQTAYVNPDNLAPDEKVDDDVYYTKEKAGDLLKRVPEVYLLMGGVFIVLQVIGCMLMTSPNQQGCCATEESEPLIDKEEVDPGAENPSLTLSDVDPTTSGRAGAESGITSEDIYHPNLAPMITLPDVTPLEMMQTRAFYTLWFNFLVNGQAVIFITTLFKAYGQTFISNDRFLTYVGSFASLFNATGRIAWGHCADRFGYRRTMVTLCSCMIALMMTLIGTHHAADTSQTLAQALYFIWICAIYWTFSGNFALFPTVTAKTFGQRNVAMNFGLVFTSQIVTGVVGALLSTSLEQVVGWFGMFCIVSAFSAIGGLLALSFNIKLNGKDV